MLSPRPAFQAAHALPSSPRPHHPALSPRRRAPAAAPRPPPLLRTAATAGTAVAAATSPLAPPPRDPLAPPPHTEALAAPPPPPPTADVLCLTDNWVAVNKPPGLHVHRSRLYPTRRGERFLLDLVREAVAAARGGRRATVLPVHRLDRPTTGVVLFALDESRNAAQLQEALQHRDDALKHYWALAFGGHAAMPPVWRNEHPLKDLAGKNRKQRPACTRFERLVAFEREGITAVRATLSTGRRHQIRRHLSHSRYPVVGDTSHGDTHRNRAARDAYGLPRCCLHARRLAFTDPFTKERVSLSVPVPDDLRRFVSRFPSYSPEEHDALLDWDDKEE